MDSIWQQHKSFILKILAGLGVCLVCWIVAASLPGSSMSDLEGEIRGFKTKIGQKKVPKSEDTRKFTTAAESLKDRIAFLADQIGETRKGDQLRAGIIEDLLRRFGMNTETTRTRYLNLARQSPVACVIDLAGQAREHLVRKAGASGVILAESVGYSKLTMEAGQFDRYLMTLEAIVTLAELAIDAKVREIEQIIIGSPPGGRFEGDEVFIREYPVGMRLRGTSGSLIKFVEAINDSNGLLVLRRLAHIKRAKADRDPDMLHADLEISALRIDPAAGIEE